MVQGIDALIIALAPVFAAGFAVQKLVEILDYVFYAISAKITDSDWSPIKKRITDKDPTIKNADEGFNKAKQAFDDANKALKASGNGRGANDDAKKSVDELEKKKNDAEKKLKDAKEEVRKSVKKFLIGITSIAIAIVIVLSTPIHVLSPINNITMNTTTGATAGTAAPVNPAADFWITVLFIAAGTEGINSILKYLGYSKEKKDADAKETEKQLKCDKCGATFSTEEALKEHQKTCQ